MLKGYKISRHFSGKWVTSLGGGVKIGPKRWERPQSQELNDKNISQKWEVLNAILCGKIEFLIF